MNWTGLFLYPVYKIIKINLCTVRVCYCIPLGNQVQGLYCKLWTKFFSFDLLPKREACRS